MGKETRIGVSVVGVLLVISMAVLYGRLTRDTGPHIDVNIGLENEHSGPTGNVVPRQPTIKREANPTTPNVSPVPRSPAQGHAQGAATGQEPSPHQSFLPDPNRRTSSQTAKQPNRDLAIPDYDQSPAYSSPFTSPVNSPLSPAEASEQGKAKPAPERDSIRAARRQGA